MSQDVTDRLRDRLNDVEDEIERLSERIAALRVEAADIKTAQRVLGSIQAVDDDTFDFNTAARFVKVERVMLELDGVDMRRRQKPASLPSVPDMIHKVVADAKEAGFDGLEPKVILAEIQRIWWPEATSESVGPIAWRMSKQGRLVKDGPVYSLPKTESSRTEKTDLDDLLGNLRKGGEAT